MLFRQINSGRIIYLWTTYMKNSGPRFACMNGMKPPTSWAALRMYERYGAPGVWNTPECMNECMNVWNPPVPCQTPKSGWYISYWNKYVWKNITLYYAAAVLNEVSCLLAPWINSLEMRYTCAQTWTHDLPIFYKGSNCSIETAHGNLTSYK